MNYAALATITDAVNRPGVWKFCRRISTGSEELAHAANSPGTFIRFAGSGSFALCPTFLLRQRHKLDRINKLYNK